MARQEIFAPYAFTGTDGTSVANNDTTNWQEQDGQDGHLQIRGNAFRSDYSAVSDTVLKVGTYTDNQYGKVQLVGTDFGNSNDAIGVTLRSQGTTYNTRDMYRVHFKNGVGAQNVKIYKVVDGTPTQVGADITVTFAANDYLLGEVETIAGEAVIRAFQNDTLIGTRTDTTSILTGGRPGISGSKSGAFILGDNFSAGILTADGPTITDAGDEAYYNGETGVPITGTTFGASQGAGKVYLSPTNSFADVNKVEQTVTSWADTAIAFTVVKGGLSLDTTVYLFVQNNAAQNNASGHAVQIQARPWVRDTLINENGAAVANETGMTMVVYHAVPTVGAPNPVQVISNVSTDGAGAMNQVTTRGALALNAPGWIFLLKDGSPAKATAMKVTFVYE